MNYIPDWLSDGFSDKVGSFLNFMCSPLYKVESAPKATLNLTKAQKDTAAKVGVIAVGIASLAIGIALVARAWNGNWGFRRQIQAVPAPDLLPQIAGTKESIFNPVQMVGRIKSLFSDKMIPFIIGVVGITGGAFLFSRLDQIMKALKK